MAGRAGIKGQDGQGARFAPFGAMEPQRISADEVKRRLDSGEAVVFIDARADDAWRQAEAQIPRSIRIPPDDAEAHLDEIRKRGLIVPYCT